MTEIKEPRYVVSFQHQLDEESVQSLIDILHNHHAVDLFFGTPGGTTVDSEILLHYLNQHPDIRLFLTREVSSAGVILALKFKGDVFVCEDLDYIMFHVIDRHQYKVRKSKNGVNVNEIRRQDVITNEKLKALLEEKLKLKSTYTHNFELGYDVFIYRDEFKEVFSKLNNFTLL